MINFLIVVVGFWLFCNLFVCFKYSPTEMYEDLWKDQTKAGRILANIFYFPAWAIKFLYCLLAKIAHILFDIV